MAIPEFSPGEVWSDEGRAIYGWSRHDFSFNIFTRKRSEIEMMMVMRRQWFEIGVAVVGFAIAVSLSAFLPDGWSRLPDIASTTTLFAVGLTEYWIMRVNARMVHGQSARINLVRKTLKAIRMSREEYERRAREGTLTLNAKTFHCVGEPRD